MKIDKAKIINKVLLSKCAICKKEITKEDIQNYNFEYSKSKLSEVIVHKSCI